MPDRGPRAGGPQLVAAAGEGLAAYAGRAGEYDQAGSRRWRQAGSGESLKQPVEPVMKTLFHRDERKEDHGDAKRIGMEAIHHGARSRTEDERAEADGEAQTICCSKEGTDTL